MQQYWAGWWRHTGDVLWQACVMVDTSQGMSLEGIVYHVPH